MFLRGIVLLAAGEQLQRLDDALAVDNALRLDQARGVALRAAIGLMFAEADGNRFLDDIVTAPGRQIAEAFNAIGLCAVAFGKWLIVGIEVAVIPARVAVVGTAE